MTRPPMLPPGWHYDDDTGALMRDVVHRMGASLPQLGLLREGHLPDHDDAGRPEELRTGAAWT